MTSERFAVEVTPDVEDDLLKLRPWTAHATRIIQQLEQNPERGHLLTGNLRALRALKFSLRGSGSYRAIYAVLEDGRICLVLLVGPHENVYRKAEGRVAALRKSGRI